MYINWCTCTFINKRNKYRQNKATATAATGNNTAAHTHTHTHTRWLVWYTLTVSMSSALFSRSHASKNQIHCTFALSLSLSLCISFHLRSISFSALNRVQSLWQRHAVHFNGAHYMYAIQRRHRLWWRQWLWRWRLHTSMHVNFHGVIFLSILDYALWVHVYWMRSWCDKWACMRDACVWCLCVMMIDFIAIKAPKIEKERNYNERISPLHQTAHCIHSFIWNIYLKFKQLFVSREGIECNTHHSRITHTHHTPNKSIDTFNWNEIMITTILQVQCNRSFVNRKTIHRIGKRLRWFCDVQSWHKKIKPNEHRTMKR